MPEINPQDAKQLIDSGAQIVDVRTDEEYSAGHIPGSAHAPIEALDPTGLERAKPVILYCFSGDRSGVAADAFAASGWDAHSIEGGLVAWQEAGLPLEGEVIQRSGLPPR